jgi:MFS family permease
MWVIWVVGLAAYMVGVMQRTSFGIAGLDAAARFDATPAVLCGFVVLQLLVYASLQIPAGLLLDRFGARRLVVAGALIMAAGQLLLAVAVGLPLAITARVLVGAGDALTFISLLSVVSAWFPARRVPLMTQLTGLIGQLGQVLSAIPFAALLHGSGWASAFGSSAALGVAVALAVLAVLRDRPPGARAATCRRTARGVARARAGLARAGHPSGPLDAHRHAVLRHGVRAAATTRRTRRAIAARRTPNTQQGGPVSGHPAVVERAYSASRR